MPDDPTAGASNASSLELSDATELASAWAHHEAQRLGIRALLIKGSSLRGHALRPPHVSADVDILIEPARFDEYCHAVRRAGWRQRPVPKIAAVLSPHSIPFIHDHWPCDLDAHRFYPGFLEDAERVFDALWERRLNIRLAHTEVPAPDRLSSFLIVGLHSMRDGAVDERHRQELSALEGIRFSENEREELGVLALETGAADTLDQLLARVGVVPATDPALVEAPALREWRARAASRSSGAYIWAIAVQNAPWREKPRLVFRAFWPTLDELRISHPDVGPTRRDVTRARASRWARGLRGMPRSVLALISRVK